MGRVMGHGFLVEEQSTLHLAARSAARAKVLEKTQPLLLVHAHVLTTSFIRAPGLGVP